MHAGVELCAFVHVLHKYKLTACRQKNQAERRKALGLSDETESHTPPGGDSGQTINVFPGTNLKKWMSFIKKVW